MSNDTNLEWCKECGRPYRLGEHVHGNNLPSEGSTPPQGHLEAHSSPQGSTPNSSKQLNDEVQSYCYSLAVAAYNGTHDDIALIANEFRDDLLKVFEKFATTLAEEASLKARIDELSHVDGLPSCFITRNGYTVHMPIDKRLGELRAELAPQKESE